MSKRSAPQTRVVYDRGPTFDRYTGKDLDNTDPSPSVQDFMTDMGEYFDRLNVSKNVRETTTAFVLGLQGMQRNIFEVGLKQVLDQLNAGEENINNPLLGGFIGGLGQLEYYAPSVYDYFNDIFGDNKTLSRSEVGDSFGISKEDLEPKEEGPNLDEIFTDGYVISGDTLYETAPNGRTIVDTYELGEDGNWVSTTTGLPAGQSEVAAKEEFPEEASAGDIFYNEAGDGFIFKDGMWGVATQEDLTYKLPENEAVDVTELTEEQQTDIWGKIKEGLGKIPGAIGKVIFGPDGMPTNVDEWIEWVDETLQAQMGPENLPFPIVITTNPTEGTWIDLKIPVNLDVNGTPIRIPLFDEDGNFVSSGELEGAFLDAKGQIFGPLGEIGEIFLDKDKNIRLDLGELKDVLLKDLTLNPDGSVTGSTAGEILVGKWFFNPDSGEWEEEVESPLEEVGLDDGDEDGLADTTDDDTTTSTDDDELGGLLEEEEEDPTPPAKAPRGRLITDKDGNPVRIIGTDGTNYVLDGDGQWVAAAVGGGDGGETVLPGTTTGGSDDDDDDGLTNDIVVVEDPVDKFPDDIEEVEVFEDDGGDDDGDDDGGDGGDDDGSEEPLVGGPVIVEGGPEGPEGGGDSEEPLVGATGATGAGGAAGKNASSSGMMGGLSYNLPGFVGVQYQPKNYTVELDRIINESLFKGMI